MEKERKRRLEHKRQMWKEKYGPKISEKIKNETEEEREKRLQHRRDVVRWRKENESEEAREKRRQYNREYLREQRRNETAEKRKKRFQYIAKWSRERRRNETEEVREKRLHHYRQCRSEKKRKEAAKEWDKRIQYQLDYQRKQREKRRNERERRLQYHRDQWEELRERNDSWEKRKQYRLDYQREKRRKETEEERERRLQYHRDWRERYGPRAPEKGRIKKGRKRKSGSRKATGQDSGSTPKNTLPPQGENSSSTAPVAPSPAVETPDVVPETPDTAPEFLTEPTGPATTAPEFLSTDPETPGPATAPEFTSTDPETTSRAPETPRTAAETMCRLRSRASRSREKESRNKKVRSKKTPDHTPSVEPHTSNMDAPGHGTQASREKICKHRKTNKEGSRSKSAHDSISSREGHAPNFGVNIHSFSGHIPNGHTPSFSGSTPTKGQGEKRLLTSRGIVYKHRATNTIGVNSKSTPDHSPSVLQREGHTSSIVTLVQMLQASVEKVSNHRKTNQEGSKSNSISALDFSLDDHTSSMKDHAPSSLEGHTDSDVEGHTRSGLDGHTSSSMRAELMGVTAQTIRQTKTKHSKTVLEQDVPDLDSTDSYVQLNPIQYLDADTENSDAKCTVVGRGGGGGGLAWDAVYYHSMALSNPDSTGMALLERRSHHPDFTCGIKPQGQAMFAVMLESDGVDA